MISSAAKHLAEVWNHPDVLPWIAFGFEKDLTAENAQKLLDSGALYFQNEHGGFVMIPKEHGIYDVHTQFRPEGRGKEAFELADKVKCVMFVDNPKCLALRTFVALDNPRAYWFARRNGFVDISSSIEQGRDGRTLLLTIKKWVKDTCR